MLTGGKHFPNFVDFSQGWLIIIISIHYFNRDSFNLEVDKLFDHFLKSTFSYFRSEHWAIEMRIHHLVHLEN